MKNVFKTIALASALSVATVATANAAEGDFPKALDVTAQEHLSASHAMLHPSEWKLFERGSNPGETGVEYNYFFSTENEAYAAVMKYNNSQSVENLLIGSLYRAEKEGWKILDHNEVTVDGLLGYKIDFARPSDEAAGLVNASYLIENDSGSYMIVFTVESKNYAKGKFDNLVSKFK